MRPLTADSLRGVWATLLLPLNADDAIDFRRLEAQTEVLGGSRLDGLYAHGTDGAVRTADDLDVERRMGEFFAAYVVPLQKAGLSNPALDKFLAAVGGWADVGTRVRWPMQSATDGQVAAARPAARRLLPELFGDSW